MLGAGATDIARGVALFIGAFSAANMLVLARAGRFEDVWWIDWSVLGPVPTYLLGPAAAVLLISFALAPRMRTWRRWATAAACVGLAIVAGINAASYLDALRSGVLFDAATVPFSAVMATVFMALAAAVAVSRESGGSTRAWAVVAVSALACAMVFPLLQVHFFGRTDYRRPADVAVVLGARVMDNGALSWSLKDRVDCGVALYRAGLVRRLIMSGGVGANGIDEADAMKRYAVASGVPEDAIVTDSHGVDTDSTVRNTARLIAGRRALVVSQFYHLPRIKMAYRAAGVDVYTVPAPESRVITKTPLFVMREIPGFWVYWARSAVRDLRG